MEHPEEGARPTHIHAFHVTVRGADETGQRLRPRSTRRADKRCGHRGNRQGGS